MTNVPIPGGTAPATASYRRRSAVSRKRFYASVTALVVGAVVAGLLAVGEPWRITPDTTGAVAKSLLGIGAVLLIVLPAFAVFQLERASAGAAWHEPRWRPTTIGWLALALALLAAIGWHGLRLAFYAARIWTGGP